MRTLCVAEAYPWPPRGGYELRLVHQIAALASLGPVDVLCLGPDRGDRLDPPVGVRVLDAPEGPERPARQWLARWVRSDLPRRLVRRDFDEARRHIPGVVDGEYDAVLYCHVDAWLATHDLIRGPGVVDFDNLENLALRGRRQLGPTLDPTASLPRRVRGRLRWLAVSAMDRIDEGRWDGVQRRVAAQVELTLVCSPLDVERSGVDNAVCVPNGYELGPDGPAHPGEGAIDPEAPVFFFVGMLAYEPNHDAVRWFATDVLPRIRRSIGGARFRVVGRDAESVADIAGRPGVEIVGSVPDLAAELVTADISVVPIRFGAGTRLKVVEAMANRLPIVSSTVGCEGIDVANGEELLIADDAGGFADACVRVVRDGDLRHRLVDAAARRYDEQYRWSVIRADLASLVVGIAGPLNGRADPAPG